VQRAGIGHDKKKAQKGTQMRTQATMLDLAQQNPSMYTQKKELRKYQQNGMLRGWMITLKKPHRKGSIFSQYTKKIPSLQEKIHFETNNASDHGQFTRMY